MTLAPVTSNNVNLNPYPNPHPNPNPYTTLNQKPNNNPLILIVFVAGDIIAGAIMLPEQIYVRSSV